MPARSPASTARKTTSTARKTTRAPVPAAKKIRRFADDVVSMLPRSLPEARADARDWLDDLQKVSRAQGRRAVKAFHGFRMEHMQTKITGVDRLLKSAPEGVRPVISLADAWIRDGAARLEKKAARLVQ